MDAMPNPFGAVFPDPLAAIAASCLIITALLWFGRSRNGPVLAMRWLVVLAIFATYRTPLHALIL